MAKQKRKYVKQATESFSERLAEQVTTNKGGLPRVRRAIEKVMGKDMGQVIVAMCDRDVSTASIHRVLLSMGVKVSYGHLHHVIRPEFIADYGYYYKVANEYIGSTDQFPDGSSRHVVHAIDGDLDWTAPVR